MEEELLGAAAVDQSSMFAVHYDEQLSVARVDLSDMAAIEVSAEQTFEALVHERHPASLVVDGEQPYLIGFAAEDVTDGIEVVERGDL